MSTTEITLTSNPVMAAGGLRMMARHIAKSMEPTLATAHADRLEQAAGDIAALVHDARRLIGPDQHDGDLQVAVALFEDLAAIRRERSLLVGQAMNDLDRAMPGIFDRLPTLSFIPSPDPSDLY